MLPDTYTPLQDNLRRWSGYLLIFVILNAALVLAGWEFNIEFLKHPLPNTDSMNPVTALLFLLAATTAILISSANQNPPKRITASIFIFLIIIAGVLKSTEIFFQIPLVVDDFLFSHKLSSPGNNQLNQMSPNTAICFIISGFALAFLKTETKTKKIPSQNLAIAAALVSLLALICYIYRMKSPVYIGSFYIPLGTHAAICFIILSLALLFIHPSKGMMKQITGKYSGSANARLLIPVVIVVPVVLGLLRLIGHWSGYISMEFGTSLLVFSIILLFLIFTWFSSRLLNRRDSQREKIVQQLKEREGQVQTIFRSAPDAIIVIDENGVIMNWNVMAEKMFGWKSKEAVGKLLADTIIPDRYKAAQTKGLKHYMETGIGSVINKTIAIQARDKNNREFEISLSIAPTSYKNRTVFVGFVRDISEQKKAEENMRYNSLLLDNVSDAVISTDENLVIKSWNDAAEKMYGYSSEEVKGKKIDFLGLDISAENLEQNKKSVKQQGFYRDEYIVNDKSGKEITILASINRIEIGDKLTGYVAVHHDITLRKKLEAQLRYFNRDLSKLVEEKTAKYRSLIEQAGDAIALFDNQNRILEVNESATALLGYSREELTTLTLNDVLSAVEIKTDPVNFTELEKGESTIKPRKMIRKNGEVVETEVNAKKLPDGTYLALIRDLTDRKKAEQELKQSYEAIRDLVSHLQDIREEERLKMAQEIHDELGQQLTIMKMDVSWLDKKLVEENPKWKEKTKALKDTLDGTVKTVRRLASELRPSVLDDMGLAVAIEWQAKEIEKRSGIKIRFQGKEELLLLNDQVKINLFRVVQESLTNVVRYAKASSVDINLQIKNKDLLLSIKDDGIGFDPENIAVKKTLGILGMKERIAALGGNLKLESSPGKGTYIQVTVPYQV